MAVRVTESEPTEAEIEAAEAYLRAQEAKSVAVPEVIPPQGRDKGEWSMGDPACMDRLCRAIIHADGDFETARVQSGCPEEIFWSLIDDDNFETRYRKLCFKLKVLPGLPAAQEAAMKEGGAYGMAQAINTSLKEDPNEAERAKMQSLRVGGKQAYIRTLRDIRDRAAKMLMMLEGAQTADDRLLHSYARDIAHSPKELEVGG